MSDSPKDEKKNNVEIEINEEPGKENKLPCLISSIVLNEVTIIT